MIEGYVQLIVILILLACPKEGQCSLFKNTKKHGFSISKLTKKVSHLEITDSSDISSTPSISQLRLKRIKWKSLNSPLKVIKSVDGGHRKTPISVASVQMHTHKGFQDKNDDGRSLEGLIYGTSYKGDFQLKGQKNKGPILSVVAFNTNWLYIPGRKYDPRIDQLCPWKSPCQALKHLERIAEHINNIDAHIFVLSEVHDLYTLEILRKLLDRSSRYEAYLVPGTDTHLQMNVGILTSLSPEAPPGRLTRMVPVGLESELGTKSMIGVSKSIVAKFLLQWHHPKTHTLTECRIALIGAHLLSGTRGSETILKRQSQAKIIADSVEEHTREGYRVIVAGDLNDFSQRTRGKRDHPTSSPVIQTISEAGNGLVNPLELIPINRRFSTWRETLLDYVLTNSTFVVNSAEIYNYHHCPEYFEGRDTLGSHFESDHYPVRADIDCVSNGSIGS